MSKIFLLIKITIYKIVTNVNFKKKGKRNPNVFDLD